MRLISVTLSVAAMAERLLLHQGEKFHLHQHQPHYSRGGGLSPTENNFGLVQRQWQQRIRDLKPRGNIHLKKCRQTTRERVGTKKRGSASQVEIN